MLARKLVKKVAACRSLGTLRLTNECRLREVAVKKECCLL